MGRCCIFSTVSPSYAFDDQWHPNDSNDTDSIPNVLQIYTFLPSPTSSHPTSIHLHTSIILTDPIKQIAWNPIKAQRLAIVTLAREENLRGFGSGVYLWDGEWQDEEERWEEGMGSGIMEAVPVPMGETAYPLVVHLEADRGAGT